MSFFFHLNTATPEPGVAEMQNLRLFSHSKGGLPNS